MARIKFGMMMTDARGKLGGHVFTKARSGATVRTKVTPANPQSLAQSVARTRLGALSQSWSSLTEEQRVAWNSRALEVGKTNIFGDSYYPSGKNLFVSVNTSVLLAGGVVVPVPPINVEIPNIINAEFIVEVGATSISSALDYEGSTADTVTLLMATKPSSAGKFNFSGQYSLFLSFPAGDNISNPVDAYNAYVARFGNPAIGQKISFQFYTVNRVTGQSSSKTTYTFLIEV